MSKPDIIIGTSPQLLAGLNAWLLGRFKRRPFVFEVRDLWPESLVASGVGDNEASFIKILAKLSAFLYRNSDAIVVVTEAFSNNIKTNFAIPEDKIHIIENGIETDQFLPKECGFIRDQLGINGKFVVSYIGTMGFAHGLDKVLETAHNIGKETSDIMFLIVGEGANKEKLKQQIAETGINNVMVIDQKPRNDIPSYINASDAMLVTLRKDDVFKTVIPPKMLEFMACGKPVILGVDGQARKILEESGGGYYVEPDNHRDLAAAIKKLHKDPAGRKKMGENGRRHVLKHFDRRQKAKEYLKILEHVIHHS